MFTASADAGAIMTYWLTRAIKLRLMKISLSSAPTSLLRGAFSTSPITIPKQSGTRRRLSVAEVSPLLVMGDRSAISLVA